MTEITGPFSYKIKVNNGSIIRRRVDHIHICHSPPHQDGSTESAFDDSFMFPPHPTTNTSPSDTTDTATQQPPALRRSTRMSHPPVRFS